MPNTGRPSRDCYSCRRRRIRCDLKRPACTQCVNKRQPCPGYRDELDLRFRVETVSSLLDEACPKRGHLIVLKKTPEEQARSHPAPQHPLSETWNDHAVPFLLSKFQRKFAESVYNVVAFVISNVQDGSALFKVCSAVGLAYMANITRSWQAVADRERAYGAALSAVNMLLQDPQQWKSDGILLSVWLLGQCELLFCLQKKFTTPVLVSGWEAHCQGLIELIRLRGPEQFATLNGRNLFGVVFNTVQLGSLLSGRQSPSEAFTWIQEIYKHCEPWEYPLVRSYIFSCHCTLLCRRLQQLGHTGPDFDELVHIMQDYHVVEKATYPLSDEQSITSQVIEPPLNPYVHPSDAGLLYLHIFTYQVSHRVRLSYHLFEFLNRASNAPGCEPYQQSVFSQLRQLCLEEFHAASRNLLEAVSKTPGWSSFNLLNQFHTDASDKETGIIRELCTSAPRTALICVDRPRLLIIP